MPYERPEYADFKNGKFYHYKTNKLVSNVIIKNLTSIIESYKIPEHLKNIMIVLQTLDEAHLNLVFKGQDSKDRWQYVYGKEYIADRHLHRVKIVRKLITIWPKLIQSYQTLCNNLPGTLDLCLGIILFLSMNLFIRTGKVRNFDDNKTQGLVTLFPTNISFNAYDILINFIGKDSIEHNMTITLTQTSPILKAIKNQYNWSKNNKFLFMYENSDNQIIAVKEEDIYSYLDKYDVYIKDIRTYGVNITFVRILWTKLRALDIESLKPKDIKNLISKSIEDTAIKIGHTKQICKSSYIIPQLLELLNNAINDKKILTMISSLKNPIMLIDKL